MDDRLPGRAEAPASEDGPVPMSEIFRHFLKLAWLAGGVLGLLRAFAPGLFGGTLS